MARYYLALAIALTLFLVIFGFAPLSAQQTIVVPDVENTINLPPMEITNEITVMSDSVRLARIADALEDIAEAIAECGCTDTGTSTVVRVGQGALVLAAFFVGYQLKRIADKDHGYSQPEDDGDSSTDIH